MSATGIKEWRRINTASEEAAEPRLAEHYEFKAGQTRGYGPPMIHSMIHATKTWVIQVTGTNLDGLPRHRFNHKRDRIVEAA